jgi:hypothetical protein
MASLLSIDNILGIGLIGGAAAYVFDIGGFKATANGWWDQLMGALKLQSTTAYDPMVPDEAAAVEGGNEGGILDEPVIIPTPKPSPEPIGGKGAWSADNFMWGGYEFPSEEAFNMNNYYPIEGSVEGIVPELKEYTMLIPKWNVLPDVRGLSRRQADNIEYQMG